MLDVQLRTSVVLAGFGVGGGDDGQTERYRGSAKLAFADFKRAPE